MKAQIFSDLHIDALPIKTIEIANDVGVVVVAGDTCEGATSAFTHLRRIVPTHVPVVMVMGNHEFYRRFIPVELAAARAQAASFNIHLLENHTVIVAGVRFIGASLWTDYQVLGSDKCLAAMSACRTGMNDHRLIGWRKKPWSRFRPQEAALLHRQSVSYLAEALRTQWDGPTAVVSHHGISRMSIDPRFQNDLLTAAYASDQSALIVATQPALWVHGHIHRTSDYRIGATRIVCNPHGYGNENPAFDGSLIVRIGE